MPRNSITCWSCGSEIPLPDRSAWDIRTEVVDGREVVVERSTTLACPACGSVGSHGRIGEDGEAADVENRAVEAVDPPESFGGH